MRRSSCLIQVLIENKRRTKTACDGVFWMLTGQKVLINSLTVVQLLDLGSLYHSSWQMLLRLDLIGWRASMSCHLQVSPGPIFKDIQRHAPKPLVCCFGWMFRIIVVLKGELLPQTEFTCTLRRFSSRMFLYSSEFIHPSIVTSLHVSVVEKHPHTWRFHHHVSPLGWY